MEVCSGVWRGEGGGREGRRAGERAGGEWTAGSVFECQSAGVMNWMIA